MRQIWVFQYAYGYILEERTHVCTRLRHLRYSVNGLEIYSEYDFKSWGIYDCVQLDNSTQASFLRLSIQNDTWRRRTKPYVPFPPLLFLPFPLSSHSLALIRTAIPDLTL